MDSGGLQTLGSAVLGTAASLWAGYWIYTLQESSVDINSWPTWLLAVVAFGGLVILIAGVRKRSDPETSVMKQRGGHGSFNVQSGRDSIIEQSRDSDV